MEPKGVSAVSLAGVAAPIAALFLAGPANGQTVSNTSGELLTPVTVEAIQPNNILPTSTDFSDAFGLDLPVTEIPRSISVITKEELQNSNIETVAILLGYLLILIPPTLTEIRPVFISGAR